MTYPFYRLVVLGAAIVIGVGLWLLLNRTRIGMMIRAGVDDRAMLAASGVNVHLRLRHRLRDRRRARRLRRRGRRHGAVDRAGRGRALPARLAGRGDRRRHGHVTGAAIGALLIGLAEQFGLAYSPTYGVVFTFVIMVVALAFRPQGIMGSAA